MIEDTYKTIDSPSQGLFRDKGSRFISFAFPVSSVEEVKKITEKMRKEYHDARHHCFAYMIGYSGDTWRINDDGEPSGTGGKPILGQIKSFGLTNILIVVVRYFGGTLLGVSGLINAYKNASADALNNSKIVSCMVQDTYELTFPYNQINSVMKIIKDENLSQYDQVFETLCFIRIKFRIRSREAVLEKFSRVEGLQYKFCGTA